MNSSFLLFLILLSFFSLPHIHWQRLAQVNNLTSSLDLFSKLNFSSCKTSGKWNSPHELYRAESLGRCVRKTHTILRLFINSTTALVCTAKSWAWFITCFVRLQDIGTFLIQKMSKMHEEETVRENERLQRRSVGHSSVRDAVISVDAFMICDLLLKYYSFKPNSSRNKVWNIICHFHDKGWSDSAIDKNKHRRIVRYFGWTPDEHYSVSSRRVIRTRTGCTNLMWLPKSISIASQACKFNNQFTFEFS